MVIAQIHPEVPGALNSLTNDSSKYDGWGLSH